MLVTEASRLLFTSSPPSSQTWHTCLLVGVRLGPISEHAGSQQTLAYHITAIEHSSRALNLLHLQNAFILDLPCGSDGEESKNLPAMQGTWVQSLGWEDILEKGVATPSSILA